MLRNTKDGHSHFGLVTEEWTCDKSWLSDWAQACTTVIEAVELSKIAGRTPLVVSLDGRSGSGKSTLASLVAGETDVVVVPVDDFYSAHISNAEWDRMTAEERWAKVFDWAKLRLEALVPLLAGRPGRWHPFDFDAGPDNQGKYRMKTDATKVGPASVIILDGAYTSGPQLADLVGLSILVEAPNEQRRARLAKREAAEILAQWHLRWDEVEDFYFSSVRPRKSFDVIVNT